MDTNRQNNEKIQSEPVILKKVMISESLYRKFKAIGTFYENELQDTREAFVVGKGIEIVYESYKDTGVINKML